MHHVFLLFSEAVSSVGPHCGPDGAHCGSDGAGAGTRRATPALLLPDGLHSVRPS